MKKIALCMIVKDEAKTIIPCLASAILLVDHVFVVDTGSTDDTKDVIGNFLAKTGVPYDIMNEPFRDFAYNRTFALEQLRMNEGIDYTLVMDADDILAYEYGFDPKAFKGALHCDLYDVAIKHDSIVHHRPQLMKNSIPFTYKGVLHEYLHIPEGHVKNALNRETVIGFSIHASTTGSRSRDPKRYERDAEVLELALKTETDPFLISRYTFYLAQSYRDCGEKVMALDAYNLRAKQGYWVEEQYVSLLEAANLMIDLNYPHEEVVTTLEKARKLVPERAEAYHTFARWCRGNSEFSKGYVFAKRGLGLKQPNGLFIQPWVYDYGLKDEFSICAYYAGHYKESLEACLDLLCSDKTPQDMMKRVAANARFASAKLAAGHYDEGAMRK